MLLVGRVAGRTGDREEGTEEFHPLYLYSFGDIVGS